VNTLDYAVLFGSILAIACYGILRTRGKKNLHDYLRGQKKQHWFFIGLSVMATQASAITFLSTPGQGYAGGLAFVQNYFAVPLALVIIASFFLPLYRHLNVYTAYEFLGKRFDQKTRLLAAAIFLLARGLAAGITIYAPAIVLSTVFGWSLPLTIIGAGLVVTAYTVIGGSDAVTHTQKYQIAIIFIGMASAFIILLQKIPCSFTDSLALAGHFGKLNAVDFSLDPKKDYTIWTGMCGGIFLMLSYFGTDQSQVQRYISGDNLRESRLGLMFNALLKIPMQFFILLLGVMLFVFYQFHPAPVFFNQNALKQAHPNGLWIKPLTVDGPPEYITTEQLKKDFENIQTRRLHDGGDQAKLDDFQVSLYRLSVKQQLEAAHVSTKDSDYIFITFILENLPHGLIGLLVAAFFAAALSSKAAELNALASTTTVDFYRPYFRKTQDVHSARSTHHAELTNDDLHYVRASKTFTAFWGLVAIAFALFANMSRNLIEASNIVGSLFSGVILGLFLIAFFLKFISATPAFLAALLAQTLVIAIWALSFFNVFSIAYLWFNAIGCLSCITLALALQPFFPAKPPAFEVLPPTPASP
jgi:Na+/proline symporter